MYLSLKPPVLIRFINFQILPPVNPLGSDFLDRCSFGDPPDPTDPASSIPSSDNFPDLEKVEGPDDVPGIVVADESGISSIGRSKNLSIDNLKDLLRFKSAAFVLELPSNRLSCKLGRP